MILIGDALRPGKRAWLELLDSHCQTAVENLKTARGWRRSTRSVRGRLRFARTESAKCALFAARTAHN